MSQIFNHILFIIINFKLHFPSILGLGYWQMPFFSHIYPQIVPNDYSYTSALCHLGFSLILLVPFLSNYLLYSLTEIFRYIPPLLALLFSQD